MKMTRRLLV